VFDDDVLLMRLLYHAVAIIRDILSPPSCSYCICILAGRAPLCNTCAGLIRPLVSVEVPVSATYSIMVGSVGAYEGPLQKLIRAKRYRKQAMAYQAGILFADHVRNMIGHHEILVPVPLHWSRYAWRGYNQADIMAREISLATGAQRCSALRRVRSTEFQALKNKTERWRNVAWSLEPQRKYAHMVAGKHVIIIDDLMTTGSTLKTAVRALKRLRPASIRAFVLARVV
jgi:ComF family protein